MKILAIDPGNLESGFVVWDGQKIIEFGKWDNKELLSCLNQNRIEHNICCIEMVASYGMPVGATVFETCVWIGRFYQCACFCHDVHLVFRKDVKIHLCGQTRAKDSNIIQALKDRFGEKGTKKAPGLTYGLSKDVWQAFALAVTYYDTRP